MNIKRDIKLWKRFFGNWHRNVPDVQIYLSDDMDYPITLSVIESSIKDLMEVELSFDNGPSGIVRLKMNPSDAHRLGTALLGFSKAWWQRNQDVRRGYLTRKMEELEKDMGIGQ